jgi:hypothetical protein
LFSARSSFWTGRDQLCGPAAVAFDTAQAGNSDVKIIADQRGHGMRTHLDNYVESGVAERKAEASKLYADFIGVLRKRG